MADFSEFINDVGLVDLQLLGDSFTWKNGVEHIIAARLDRFLVFEEWDVGFRNIKQSILHRVTSDHSPLLLQSGNWEPAKSYFKFENWWLLTEGFKESQMLVGIFLLRR